MAKALAELLDEGVTGRYVLVRSDLNVPLKDGVVTDDGRVRASLPVIEKLAKAGARVIVTAHLGRPKGQVDPQYSIAPAAARLAELASSPLRTVVSGRLLSPPLFRERTKIASWSVELVYSGAGRPTWLSSRKSALSLADCADAAESSTSGSCGVSTT